MVILVISRTLSDKESSACCSAHAEGKNLVDSLLDVFQSTHISSRRLERRDNLGQVLLGDGVVGHREEVDEDQSELVLVRARHLVPVAEDVEDGRLGL